MLLVQFRASTVVAIAAHGNSDPYACSLGGPADVSAVEIIATRMRGGGGSGSRAHLGGGTRKPRRRRLHPPDRNPTATEAAADMASAASGRWVMGAGAAAEVQI